jgi:hypothetical protein
VVTGKVVIQTGWVKNTVLSLFVPLKNEGENNLFLLANGTNRRDSCVLGRVRNPNIHRMVILPEPDGGRMVGKGRVEWGAENSYGDLLATSRLL